METEIETKRIILARAGSVGDKHPPKLVIEVAVQIDDKPSLNEFRIFYKQQAKSLADALQGSLPGGTLDELLAELMSRRASLFRVPLIDMEKS